MDSIAKKAVKGNQIFNKYVICMGSSNPYYAYIEKFVEYMRGYL